MFHQPIPREEAIEVQAFLDLFQSAPRSMVDHDQLAFTSIGEGCAVSLPFAPAIGLNRVLGLTNVTDLDRALEWFAGRGGARHVQINRSQANREVLQWISDRGLRQLDGSWTKLTRQVPATPMPWTSPVEVRLAGKSESKLFGELMCLGFGFPPKLAPLWSSLVGKQGWTCHVACWDDIPVGTAAMFVADGYAWLGGGTTLPEYRGRGIQGVLIRDRLNVGAELGVDVFAVETAEPVPGRNRTSYDNLLRSGFQPLYTRENLLIEHSSPSTSPSVVANCGPSHL